MSILMQFQMKILKTSSEMSFEDLVTKYTLKIKTDFTCVFSLIAVKYPNSVISGQVRLSTGLATRFLSTEEKHICQP